jgi:hypothetical protein
LDHGFEVYWIQPLSPSLSGCHVVSTFLWHRPLNWFSALPQPQKQQWSMDWNFSDKINISTFKLIYFRYFSQQWELLLLRFEMYMNNSFKLFHSFMVKRFHKNIFSFFPHDIYQIFSQISQFS